VAKSNRDRGHRGLPSATRALPCWTLARQRPPRSVAAAKTDKAMGPAPLDVNEVQVRIAIMNGYTALGIPVTKTVG